MAPKKSGGRGRWWGFSFASSSRNPPTVINISSDTSVETDPSENVSIGGPVENSYVPEVTPDQTSEPRGANVVGRRHSASTGGSRGSAYGMNDQVDEPRGLAEMRRSMSISGARGDMYGQSGQTVEPRRASVSEGRRTRSYGINATIESGQASTSRRRREASPIIPSPPSVINISSDSSYGQIDQGGSIPEEQNDAMMQSPHISESYGTSDTIDSYHTLSTGSSKQYTENSQSTWNDPYGIPAEYSHLTHDPPAHDQMFGIESPAQIGEPEPLSPMSNEDPRELEALVAPFHNDNEESNAAINRLIYGANYHESSINQEQNNPTRFGVPDNNPDEDNNGGQGNEGNPAPFVGINAYEVGESSRPRAITPDEELEFNLRGYGSYGSSGPLIRQTARKSVRPPPRRTPSPRPPSPPPATPTVMVRCHLCGEVRYHSSFCPYVVNYANTGPEDILCFMCGARGHYSTMCPMNVGNQQAPPPAPPSTSSGRRSSSRHGPRN